LELAAAESALELAAESALELPAEPALELAAESALDPLDAALDPLVLALDAAELVLDLLLLIDQRLLIRSQGTRGDVSGESAGGAENTSGVLSLLVILEPPRNAKSTSSSATLTESSVGDHDQCTTYTQRQGEDSECSSGIKHIAYHKVGFSIQIQGLSQ
jgi:hypothetical protein